MARVVFVTGKGGVGKTTIAAMLARATEDRDQAACLLDIYGSIDEREAVSAFLTRLVRLRWVSHRLLDSRSFQALAAALPGLVDIARLDAVRHRSERERLVIDGPASGHALAMLLAPMRLARLALAGPARRMARNLAAFVTDKSLMSVVVVASPEEMAVVEAKETCTALAGEGIAHRLLINGIYPERLNHEQAAWLERTQASPDAMVHLARRRRQLEAVAGLQPVPFSTPFRFSPEGLPPELGRRFLEQGE